MNNTGQELIDEYEGLLFLSGVKLCRGTRIRVVRKFIRKISLKRLAELTDIPVNMLVKYERNYPILESHKENLEKQLGKILED